MLSIENLEVVYNDIALAVAGISLKVGAGDRICLLGTNGSGKTSTVRAIVGTLSLFEAEIKKGRITFFEQSLLGRSPEQIVRNGIALVPEGRRILAELSVRDNLLLGAYTRSSRGEVAADEERVLNYFPILRQRYRSPAGYLSGGEQQMLAIARAYMVRPKLLICDEPSLGLAPKMVINIFDILYRIVQDEGTAVLLIEQNAPIALAFSQYGYVMESGRLVLEGSSSKLRENEDVQEFYLGVGSAGEQKSYRDVKTYKKVKKWLN